MSTLPKVLIAATGVMAVASTILTLKDYHDAKELAADGQACNDCAGIVDPTCDEEAE